MKSRLAVHDAVCLKPLLFGLDRTESPFELVVDTPARNSLKFSERSEEIRSAFLSPIDYARHGGEYCIMPNIAVSSSLPTGTLQLVLKSNLHNVETLAVDIRYTSEIILAKIILAEKYRSHANHQSLKIVPMIASPDIMLQKADAALIVTDGAPLIEGKDLFVVDLIEDWFDLTELPYIHGFWVGREEEFTEEEARSLLSAKKDGIQLRSKIAQALALQGGRSSQEVMNYLSTFSYELTNLEEESLQEFFHYAYFYGVLNDIPEVTFFDLETSSQQNN
jgi:chorismate dehydratase